jgi:hypothetical protein
MVQNMWNPEYYLGVFKMQRADGSTALRTGKYKDFIEHAAGESFDINASTSQTFQRFPMTCLPVPGESPWVTELLRASVSGSPEQKTGASPQRAKRKRAAPGDQDAEMSPPSHVSAHLATTLSIRAVEEESKHKRMRRAPEAMDTDTGDAASADHVLTPATPHIALPSVLVKVYDERECPLKICQAAEFVGVFSASPFLTTLQRDPFLEDFGGTQPPASRVPRLHVICFRPLNEGFPLVQLVGSPQHEAGEMERIDRCRDR